MSCSQVLDLKPHESTKSHGTDGGYPVAVYPLFDFDLSTPCEVPRLRSGRSAAAGINLIPQRTDENQNHACWC